MQYKYSMSYNKSETSSESSSPSIKSIKKSHKHNSSSEEIKLSTSPKKKTSTSLTRKEKHCLDIVEDLNGKTFQDNINKIRKQPNIIESFPNIILYVSELDESTDYCVFKFKFFNIISNMFYVVRDMGISLKYHEFIWIIDDLDLTGVRRHAMKIVVKSKNNLLECDVASIGTKGFIIPPLIINNKTYIQSSVPILLGLYLINSLGINATGITDAATVPITCPLGKSDSFTIDSYLLDQRMLVCSKSIYYKYGFKDVDEKEKRPICKITIQEILDDYSIRIKYSGMLEAQFKLQDYDYYVDEELEKIFNINRPIAEKVIKLLHKEENVNISVKDWIQKVPIKEQNCRAVMLTSLFDQVLSSEFTYKGKLYKEAKFFELYIENRASRFINKDVKSTLDNIYKNGLPITK